MQSETPSPFPIACSRRKASPNATSICWRELMANIPPPPPESEGFLPEADASCSVARSLFPHTERSSTAPRRNAPHVLRFTSHPRYSVLASLVLTNPSTTSIVKCVNHAANMPCSEAVVAATRREKSSIRGEVRRIAERDAFAFSDSLFKAEYKFKSNDYLLA